MAVLSPFMLGIYTRHLHVSEDGSLEQRVELVRIDLRAVALLSPLLNVHAACSSAGRPQQSRARDQARANGEAP